MTAIKVAPVKPSVSRELLEKIDVRVGTIELVKDVARSEKLVKLTVNFGDRRRSILVGMKKILRKLRGSRRCLSLISNQEG
jgi:tRNA-binding EMAP/Myf-like protein